MNQCPDCDQCFATRQTLATHFASEVCLVKEDTEFVCSDCKKSFSTKGSLTRHVDSKVCLKKLVPEDTRCEGCNEEFKNKYILKTHKKTCNALIYDLAPITKESLREIAENISLTSLSVDKIVDISIKYCLEGRVCRIGKTGKHFVWFKDGKFIDDQYGILLANEVLSFIKPRILSKIRKFNRTPKNSSDEEKGTNFFKGDISDLLGSNFEKKFPRLLSTKLPDSSREDAYMPQEREEEEIISPRKNEDIPLEERLSVKTISDTILRWKNKLDRTEDDASEVNRIQGVIDSLEIRKAKAMDWERKQDQERKEMWENFILSAPI